MKFCLISLLKTFSGWSRSHILLEIVFSIAITDAYLGLILLLRYVMAEGSPSLRKDGFRFFGRKTDSPASTRKISKEREAAQDEGNNSPRLVAQPAIKLSDVSLSEFTPNAALSNFRARRKTISEYLAPLTGLFGPRRISALERLSYGPSPTKLSPAEDERRRVKGKC